MPIGLIMPFAGTTPPAGWEVCDGRLLAVTAFPDLFAAIGSRFGGDGVTDFALPDLRGRQFLGAGQGPDTAAYAPADSGGAEALVLTADQLPAHDHDITLREIGLQLPAAGAQATFTTPATGLIPGDGHTIFDNGGIEVSVPVQAYADASRADGRFLAPAIEGGLAVLPAGGGVPVPLGAPWLAATAIIRATL
ncbi:phage tail protein [Tistrella mobilis]